MLIGKGFESHKREHARYRKRMYSEGQETNQKI